MKPRHRLRRVLTALTRLITCSQQPAGSPPLVSIPGSEHHTIQSSYVDQTYQIKVWLPLDYAGSKDSFLTVYLLDADLHFGMASDIVRWLQRFQEIPGVIVVGISYGQGDGAWWDNRTRDYTPSNDRTRLWGDWPLAGGAEDFRAFLKEELIPFIENRYRVLSGSRVIAGISFGGLFSAHVLFTEPELFQGYIFSSAPFAWDDGALWRAEREYFANHKRLPAFVFSAVGEWEDPERMVKPWQAFNTHLKSRRYEGLLFEAVLFERETHFSVWPAAFTRGLKYVVSEQYRSRLFKETHRETP